jgi:hypothetical protein
VRLHRPARRRIASVVVHVSGRRVRSLHGSAVRSRITLRRMPTRRYRLRVTVEMTDGQRIVRSRTYRTCVPRRRASSSRAVTAVSLSSELAQRLASLALVCRVLQGA